MTDHPYKSRARHERPTQMPPGGLAPPAGRTLASDGSEIGPDEAEFGRAMDEYKRASGRLFPTWSEAGGLSP